MLATRLTIAATALGLAMGYAEAADILGGSNDSGAPGNCWIVTLGGYGAAVPEFPGSKNLTFSFRPVFNAYRAGEREWLTLPNDAFGLTLYQTANFRMGAAADYLQNRDHREDSALTGLHDIGYTAELGAFAEYYPVPFLRTRVELLQGVTGAEGFAANLMADFIFKPDAPWLFTAGPRLRFVNTQYESEFFSISDTEAPLSGLTPYHASGGLNFAGIDATARYYVNENLSLRAFAEWDRLVGDAADSPLVKIKGSADQLQFGLGAAYRFSYGP